MSRTRGIGIALMFVAATGGLLWLIGLPEAGPATAPTLTIDAVGAGDGISTEQAAAIADSLADRLARQHGINQGSDFTLGGTLSISASRMAISVRLQDRTGALVWSATFWRSRDAHAELIGDIADAVAEAVYANTTGVPR